MALHLGRTAWLRLAARLSNGYGGEDSRRAAVSDGTRRRRCSMCTEYAVKVRQAEPRGDRYTGPEEDHCTLQRCSAG